MNSRMNSRMISRMISRWINRMGRRALALALLGGALLTVACDQSMGGACVDSSDCEGDGVCLKGACAAYSCASYTVEGFDAQAARSCTDGFECAEIAGSRVCAQACERDDECPGAQTCTETSDGSGRYCL